MYLLKPAYKLKRRFFIKNRLYDYDRRGKDGKPRELHIEKGVRCSKTEVISSRKIPSCSDGTRMIGSCEYFQVKELKLMGKEHGALLQREKLSGVDFP